MKENCDSLNVNISGIESLSTFESRKDTLPQHEAFLTLPSGKNQIIEMNDYVMVEENFSVNINQPKGERLFVNVSGS